MIEIQEINTPLDCRIIRNEFYAYDPVNSNEADNIKYLSEDLFQCSFPKDDLIIDLGWYGNATTGKGEFMIQVIVNENWDMPSNTIYSKSADETKELLTKILLYYTRTQVKEEED